MAINEWKIWRKWFPPPAEEKTDIPADLEAAYRFFSESERDRKQLAKDLSQSRVLWNEAKVVDENLRLENLKFQIGLFDRITQNYESFQNDVDINGLRVKKIATELLRRAEAAGLTDLVEQRKNNPRWQGRW